MHYQEIGRAPCTNRCVQFNVSGEKHLHLRQVWRYTSASKDTSSALANAAPACPPQGDASLKVSYGVRSFSFAMRPAAILNTTLPVMSKHRCAICCTRTPSPPPSLLPAEPHADPDVGRASILVREGHNFSATDAESGTSGRRDKPTAATTWNWWSSWRQLGSSWFHGQQCVGTCATSYTANVSPMNTSSMRCTASDVLYPNLAASLGLNLRNCSHAQTRRRLLR